MEQEMNLGQSVSVELIKETHKIVNAYSERAITCEKCGNKRFWLVRCEYCGNTEQKF